MGIFAVIAGNPGAGKTRFVRSLPNVGIVDTDRNSFMEVKSGIIEQCSSIASIKRAISSFVKSDAIKTIVIDSFTRLNYIKLSEWFEKTKGSGSRTRDPMDVLFNTQGRPWYEMRIEVEMDIINPLLSSGKNIFIVCHLKTVTIGREEQVTYLELDMTNGLRDTVYVPSNQVLLIDRVPYAGGAKEKVYMHTSHTNEFKYAKDCTYRLPRGRFELDDDNLSRKYLELMKGESQR